MQNFYIEFFNPSSYALLIFVVILGILFYSFRNSRQKKGALLLLIFRSILLLLALFLFLSPVAKWQKTEKNDAIVEFWLDNSKSIPRQSTVNKKDLIGKIDQSIPKNVTVKLLAFDQELREVKSTKDLNFTGESTDLSQLFRQRNRQPDAAVLISDGQVNSGENFYNRNKYEFPIYAVGIGDTTDLADASVKKITLPKKKVKQQEPITITAEVQIPKTGATVQLLLNDNIMDSKKVKSTGTGFLQSVEFQLTPEKSGENRVAVNISDQADKNPHNNSQTQLLNVIPGNKEILILCDAPSFETRSLMTIFNEKEEMNAQVAFFDKGQWFPKSIENQAYDLAIMLNLPQKNQTNPYLSKWRQMKIPAIIYVTKSTAINQLNQLIGQPIVKDFSRQTSEAVVQRSKTAHPVLLNLQQKKSWRNLPPINYDFSKISINSDFDVLIGTSELNPNPVVAISDEKEMGILIGQNFWKWQLMAEETYPRLMWNLVTYLTEDNSQSNVQVAIDKKMLLTGEKANFSGNIYDLQGNKIRDADVQVTIKQQGKMVDEFYLTPDNEKFSGHYLFKTAGAYDIEIQAKKEGNSLGKKELSVTVEDRVLEYVKLRQNRELLQTITKRSKGKMIKFESIPALAQNIKETKPETVTNREIALYNHKLFFILLLVILITEWISRKYLGHL